MYVRHRHRMVRQSVFEDLRATLEATQWIGHDTLGLLGPNPLVLLDYFPDQEGTGDRIQLNTLALSHGQSSDLVEAELGGLMAQEYTFHYAFYTPDDAIAMALFQDLQDRYTGLTAPEFITLYNYLTEEPTEVVRMEVESFRYARDVDRVTPAGMTLYFGELVLTDYVDQGA